MKINPMQVGAVIVGACLLSANGADLVTNGSFENYTGTTTLDANGGKPLSASLSLDNWEYTAPSGTAVGLLKGTSAFKNVANVKGDIACYFQKNCSLSQNITVTEAGTYWVSFRYAPRYDNSVYRNGRFYIEIDGKEVGHADCGQDTTFRTAVMETELSVGDHTLVIRHSNELSTDKEKRSNSVIDGISITPKTNLLFNGSFEDYMGVMPSGHCFGPNVTAEANADVWEGVSYGLSEASSPFLEDGSGIPFEGSTALHFNGVGEISQNVKIPEDGTYEISFVYAPRDTTYYYGGRVNVWIDDAKVGYVDCDNTTAKFRRYMVRAQIAAGSHVFKLTHTLDNPRDLTRWTPCSAIDDVSIVKVDGGNLLANGGFEDYIGTLSGIEAGFSDSFKVDTWKYEDGTGLATTNSNFLSNKSGSPYEGNVSLFFNGAHSVSQTVYVAETGDYDISFAYAPRDTVYYYGGRLHVVIDGEEACDSVSCDNATSTFRRYMVRIPISAGLHVFQLRHTIEDNTHRTACSAVDAVDMRAADALLLNGDFDAGSVLESSGSSMSSDGAYSNPGWVAAGQCGLARAGYPSGSPWASSNLSPTGKYSLFMHTANYKGRILDAASAMQSFDVTTKGVYELRFSYASRPFNNYKGGKIYVRVFKGEGTAGSPIYERSVTADSLTAFEEFVGNVKFHEPGKYTLQFYAPQPEYTETAENNRGVVIDNVSVEYAGKLPGLMIIFK